MRRRGIRDEEGTGDAERDLFLGAVLGRRLEASVASSAVLFCEVDLVRADRGRDVDEVQGGVVGDEGLGEVRGQGGDSCDPMGESGTFRASAAADLILSAGAAASRPSFLRAAVPREPPGSSTCRCCIKLFANRLRGCRSAGSLESVILSVAAAASVCAAVVVILGPLSLAGEEEEREELRRLPRNGWRRLLFVLLLLFFVFLESPAVEACEGGAAAALSWEPPREVIASEESGSRMTMSDGLTASPAADSLSPELAISASSEVDLFVSAAAELVRIFVVLEDKGDPSGTKP